MYTHPKYACICCYFGKWPSTFAYWLKSCEYNKGIDFFLVSDIATDEYEIPENVHVVRKSFADVQLLVADKFKGIDVSLERPYKLCDFKTAYGYIFSDIFDGYDYWGFYDIDTIWGDILKFIPDNEDNHFVRIFPCGHLSFFRNSAPYDKIYELVNKIEGMPCRNNMQGKNVVSWQKCFSINESCYYDEEGGLEPYLISTELPNYLAVDFDNILPPWRFDHFYIINFPEKSQNVVYSFEYGKLYRCYLNKAKVKKEEISYLHYPKRQLKCLSKSCDKYLIVPNKIIDWIKLKNYVVIFYGRKRVFQKYLFRLLHKISLN